MTVSRPTFTVSGLRALAQAQIVTPSPTLTPVGGMLLCRGLWRSSKSIVKGLQIFATPSTCLVTDYPLQPCHHLRWILPRKDCCPIWVRDTTKQFPCTSRLKTNIDTTSQRPNQHWWLMLPWLPWPLWLLLLHRAFTDYGINPYI